MADALAPVVPVPPLHAWADPFAALAPHVRLAETPVAQVVVRSVDPDVIGRLALPSACRMRHSDNETAVWLGPDEWLLYRAGISGHDYRDEVAHRAGTGAYVLDATGQRTRLVLGGDHARTILAHGCAIDLSDRSFGADDAAQTLLGQTGIILHRTGSDDEFAVFVRSSFADYLARWIVDAAVEYTTVDDPVVTSPTSC